MSSSLGTLETFCAIQASRVARSFEQTRERAAQRLSDLVQEQAKEEWKKEHRLYLRSLKRSQTKAAQRYQTRAAQRYQIRAHNDSC